MAFAELARRAAVSAAACKLAAETLAFPPEIAAHIERVCRGVYLLTTMKREEMFSDGR